MQQRPLPFLLYLSFFYLEYVSVLCISTWRMYVSSVSLPGVCICPLYLYLDYVSILCFTWSMYLSSVSLPGECICPLYFYLENVSVLCVDCVNLEAEVQLLCQASDSDVLRLIRRYK